MNELKELNVKLQNLKNEVSRLRDNLNKINKEKEEWFKKRVELNQKIYPLIKEIKDIKLKRDKSNIDIIELKKKRDGYNSEVKKLISEIRELNSKKQLLFKKLGLKEDPMKMKEVISKLEKRIETEALSFNEEKKVMKKINQLKKIFGKNSELKNILDNIDKVSKMIEEKKNKAEEIHKKIQEQYKGRIDYSDFKDLSKQINDLRDERDEISKNFLDFKKQFTKLNKNLKEKLKELGGLQKEINYDKNKKEQEEVVKTKKQIEDKIRLVEEKLKTKKKLDTDDIIVLQDTGL